MNLTTGTFKTKIALFFVGRFLARTERYELKLYYFKISIVWGFQNGISLPCYYFLNPASFYQQGELISSTANLQSLIVKTRSRGVGQREEMHEGWSEAKEKREVLRHATLSTLSFFTPFGKPGWPPRVDEWAAW